MKSIALVLLLLCLQLDLPFASPAHPSPIPNLSSSPEIWSYAICTDYAICFMFLTMMLGNQTGADLKTRSAKNVIVVERKGGNGGHGGRGGGGARGRLIPLYGGARGSRRSNGHHTSGSNRFFTSLNLKAATLLFTAILVGI